MGNPGEAGLPISMKFIFGAELKEYEVLGVILKNCSQLKFRMHRNKNKQQRVACL